MRIRLQSSIEQRVSAFVDTYRALCEKTGHVILPRRAMTMDAVYPFAPSLTIVELSEPDDWRVRLSGTAVCERMGVDVTGENALTALPIGERHRLKRLVARMFRKTCGLRALATESYSNGETSVLDTIALPLIGAEGQRMVVTYALVVRDIENRFGARPVAQRTRLLSHWDVDLQKRKPSAAEFRLAG